MTKKNKKKLRKRIKKLHILTGVFSSLFLLNITITGILLDWTKDSTWVHTKVISPTLLNWYNLYPTGKPYGIIINNMLIFQWGKLIKVNQQEFFINDKLIAIIKQYKKIVLIFSKQVYIFDKQLQLIEKINALSLPIDKKIFTTYQHKNNFYLETDRGFFSIDESWQNFTKIPKKKSPEKLQLQALTKTTLQQAKQSLSNENLSAYRILNDLHSGSFFGKIGYFLNRLASFSLLYLIISGLLLYKKQKKKSKKKHAKIHS